MRFSLKSSENPAAMKCDSLVVPVFDDNKLSPAARQLDAALGRALAKLLKAGEFTASSGKVLALPLVDGCAASRVVLWGLGSKQQLDRLQWHRATAALAKSLNSYKGKHAAVIADLSLPKATPQRWALQQLAQSISAASYRYTTTKSKKPKSLPELNRVTLLSDNTDAATRRQIQAGSAIGAGLHTTRELGNLPGNICTPKYLASEARKLGRRHDNVKTQVLGEKRMRELGMGSLLSVGTGSVEESQLIIMDYRGGKKSQQPQVLVGKGITFDTGGISLKPGAKMDEMKFDMCGAATVMGAMQAIADMALPLNVVGIIAAAENMPAGNATKPGDVVTSMAGKTIEVLNTDAEGRLVLCDALHYARRFKPEAIIDMATLTGACIVALGHHATGLMSNDDALADALLKAGENSADRSWRLPLWEDYRKQINTPFADLANIGGPSAGTITAGCFLAAFTEGMRWAHLDIAGTAWNQGGGKGASGRPLAMVCEYLMQCAGTAAH